MIRYLLAFFLAFLLFAALASGVIAWRFWVLHDSDERGLLRYQIGKINAAPSDIDTVFIGDSSLGNAVDVRLFDTLTGHHSLNLALSGKYGFAGDTAMLHRAIDRLPVKQVVIMHSTDLFIRQTEYNEAAIALYKSWPIDLPLMHQLQIAARMVSRLTEYGRAADTLRRAATDDWTTLITTTDYVPQQPPESFNLIGGSPFRPAQANVEKLPFLQQLANLCHARQLNCIYLHGPLHARLAAINDRFFTHINGLIKVAGIPVLCFGALSMPENVVGDAYEHVRQEKRPASTRYYAALLQHYWRGEMAPDCTAPADLWAH